MAGFTSNVDIPLSQLESQAGGQTLRTEGGTYDQVRNVKKSSQRLLAALQEEKLAFPLFVLIAQQQMSALFDENVSNLKMISGLYDQCQETLAQYSDFLMTTAEPQAYDAMIPPLAKLLQVYQLDPSQAFSIARPKFAYLLSVFTCIASEVCIEGLLQSETAGTFETGEMPQGHTYASYGMLRTLAEDVEKVLPAATFEGCSYVVLPIFFCVLLKEIYPARCFTSSFGSCRFTTSISRPNGTRSRSPSRRRPSRRSTATERWTRPSGARSRSDARV